MSKIRVVVGGQLGSESKGRTAGFLLGRDISPAPQLTIRTGGPQAGHIVVGRDPDNHNNNGYHWKLRSVPVGAVCRSDALLAIASGSEVDPERLSFELGELDRAGYRATDRIVLDPAATWMTPEYKNCEVNSDLKDRIGSTTTGVGEARCDRIMRHAHTVGSASTTDDPWALTSIRDLADRHLRIGGDVLIEAAQGCHLDLYRGHYPFTTSGRTTAIDALASAEVVPWAYPDCELQIWIAVRTYPIRVGGNSGPLVNETSWDAIGVPPEITTVTKRVRRVGEWDAEQVRQSVQWCGGVPAVRLSLSHFDYLFPQVATARDADEFPPEAHDWIAKAEYEAGAPIALVGVAPDRTLIYRGDLI